MSLAKAVIEILPIGGLDQSRGKWATVPTPSGVLAAQFHELENLIYTRTGELEKRPGLVAMGDTTTDSFALGPTTSVHVGGSELVAIGTRAEETSALPGEPGAYLWSWSPGAARWAAKTGVPQLSVERTSGVRGETDLGDFPTQVARIGTVEMIAYTVGNDLYARVVDRASGAVLLDNTQFTTAALGGKYALFVCGGVFTVVWVTAANQLRRGTLNPTTLAASSASVGAAYTAAVGYWDAIPTVSGKWAVVALVGAGGDVVVRRIDNAAGTVDASTAELGRAGTKCSLGFRVGYSFLLLAWNDRTDIRAKHYIESTLATALADWLVEPLASFFASVVQELSCNFDDQNRSFVVWNATTVTSDYPALWIRAFDTLGAALMTSRRVYHAGLQAKPFRCGGSLYALVNAYQFGSFVLGRRYGYALLNLSRRFYEIGSAYQVALEGCLGAADATGLDVATCAEHLAWIQADSSEALFCAVVTAATDTEPAGSPGAKSWVDVIRLRAPTTLDGLWSSAYGAQTLHLTSALPVQYDGQAAVEIAFLEPPWQYATPVLTYGASGLVAATPPARYGYLMVWEWLDAKGRIHRSRLSDPVEVLVDAGVSTHAVVDFEVATTGITRRGSNADGEKQAARLAVFRTLAGGSVYYRCDDNGEINNTGAATITYQDDESDAALLAAERGEIYTAGGVLENETPPAARHVHVSNGRVWLTSAEGPEVWPSREVVPGEAPAFSPFLAITVDDTDERLVATAPLGSEIVIFGERSIYLLDAGGGPGDAGGLWPPLQTLQASAGCVSGRSVVAFKDGVIFRDPDGIKLLTRGRTIVDLGAAVRSLTDANPHTLDVSVDASRERVVFLVSPSETSAEGVYLVYDYRHVGPDGIGSWSTWTTEEDPSAARLALWGTSLVVAAASTPHQEGIGATPGYDGIGGGAQWITGRFTTPWLRLGALGGYQRVWRVVLELQQRSAHGLVVDVYADGDDTTPVQTETWTVTQIQALQGLPRERIVMGLKVQKCQSVRFRVSDSAPAVTVADSPTGFTHHGLTLEIGQKQGVEKAQKANTRLCLYPS